MPFIVTSYEFVSTSGRQGCNLRRRRNTMLQKRMPYGYHRGVGPFCAGGGVMSDGRALTMARFYSAFVTRS